MIVGTERQENLLDLFPAGISGWNPRSFRGRVKERSIVSSTPTVRKERRQPTPEEFQDVQAGPEFQQLRKTFRSFTFPMSVAFFIWYIAYVLIATYFPEQMGQPFLGLNVGLWFGLAQFLTTFIITWIYVVYANKRIEPQAAEIREKMEG